MVTWGSRKVGDLLALGNGLLIAIVLVQLASIYHFRFDLTEEGRYTIKQPTIEMLRQLEDDLTANGLRARAVVPAALGSALLAKQSGRAECAVLESVLEGLAIDIVTTFLATPFGGGRHQGRVSKIDALDQAR